MKGGSCLHVSAQKLRHRADGEAYDCRKQVFPTPGYLGGEASKISSVELLTIYCSICTYETKAASAKRFLHAGFPQAV